MTTTAWLIACGVCFAVGSSFGVVIAALMVAARGN